MAAAAMRFTAPILRRQTTTTASSCRQVSTLASTIARQQCAYRPLANRLRGAQTPSLTRRSFSAGYQLQEKKYTEEHEWIELDADGKIGTIGITDYAANALGDVVYVELPELDLEVTKGDSIGAVESVKSASDIMTPVSGKIVEANGLLEEKPGTINKGPEAEGWLAKIEVTDPKQLDSLMSKEDYDAYQKD